MPTTLSAVTGTVSRYTSWPPMALIAATRTGAAAMLMEGQSGEVVKGFLADLLVVAGEPQNDVRLLQMPGNIKLVMKDGLIYKNLFDARH